MTYARESEGIARVEESRPKKQRQLTALQNRADRLSSWVTAGTRQSPGNERPGWFERGLAGVKKGAHLGKG